MVENGLGFMETGTDYFFDKFFTSTDLCQNLFANKTPSCRTVLAGHRGLPTELFEKTKLKLLRADTNEMRTWPLLDPCS